jgi:hypothetical protein
MIIGLSGKELETPLPQLRPPLREGFETSQGKIRTAKEEAVLQKVRRVQADGTICPNETRSSLVEGLIP